MSVNLSNHPILNPDTSVELEEIFLAVFQILDVEFLSCPNSVNRIIRIYSAIYYRKIIRQSDFCLAQLCVSGMIIPIPRNISAALISGKATAAFIQTSVDVYTTMLLGNLFDDHLLAIIHDAFNSGHREAELRE